jgi:phospholipase C
VGFVRRHVIGRLRGDAHDPVRRLDRWLLATLLEEGASTANELVKSRRVQLGRHGKDDPHLASSDVRRWLWSAKERGLIEAHTVDLDGRPLNPPEWVVSDAGRQRLRQVSGASAKVAESVAWLIRAPNGWREAVEAIAEQGEASTGPAPALRPQMPTLRRNPGDALSDEEARRNLKKIEHIVVLMMENRSFDQMLGYLDDGRNEVDGIRSARSNRHEGQTYEPKRLTRTRMPKSMDPPHDAAAIADQINGGEMDGFARSFVEATEGASAEMVMGYYTYEELPVYDYLAHSFCLCDRWFSSVPGATWPNRLYALTGTSVRGREGLFDNGVFFDLPSFVRCLPDQSAATGWRWYSSDPGTLRLVDDHYRLDTQADFHHENFRRVEKYALDPGYVWADGEMRLDGGSGFLSDCARNSLPKVSWIDPNFVDLSILDPTSNDDHPPSDVLAGQELVMLIFQALSQSECWSKSLLVITYDEHGGFYDHVKPDPAPEPTPQFETYGVRVPALVISPLVEPHTVSKRTYDHTSLIRTILERFAPDTVADMPPRVAMAEHLGQLLTGSPDNVGQAPDHREVFERLGDWRRRHAEDKAVASEQVADPPDRRVIRGFPAEVLEGGRRLRADGLPAGHP